MFDLTTPLVVVRMIDRGVGGRSVETVLAYGGLLVLMALCGLCFYACLPENGVSRFAGHGNRHAKRLVRAR
ncbi:MAG: hypothetical protein ACLTSX_05520 [Collinsella sp.]